MPAGRRVPNTSRPKRPGAPRSQGRTPNEEGTLASLFGSLGHLASALNNPDAFTISTIAITALICAEKGLDLLTCAGFAISAMVAYVSLQALRMWNQRHLKRLDIDAKYAKGERELDSAIRHRAGKRIAREQKTAAKRDFS